MMLRTTILILIPVAIAATSSAAAQRRYPPEKFDPPAGVLSPSPPAMVYSRWAKVCCATKPGAKSLCLTMKAARLSTGEFIAGAALIEQQGEAERLLRVILPPGLRVSEGARMFIDDEAPRRAEYGRCLSNGCIAEFGVDGAFVERLKTGQQLNLQGFRLPGQAVSYRLPLADFAKAQEGSPTDPTSFEGEEKKQQEELLNRIERERKRAN